VRALSLEEARAIIATSPDIFWVFFKEKQRGKQFSVVIFLKTMHKGRRKDKCINMSAIEWSNISTKKDKAWKQ